MNDWLARRSAWQYFLISGGGVFLGCLIGAEAIPGPKGHHIALRYVITIGLFLAVTFGAVGTYKQQGQRPGDPDDPEQ
ncbi:MAG TPA: hypothetical protein VGI00_19380 [Streptosporangiaceae bacterium]|jgi:hypothetical protein